LSGVRCHGKTVIGGDAAEQACQQSAVRPELELLSELRRDSRGEGGTRLAVLMVADDDCCNHCRHKSGQHGLSKIRALHLDRFHLVEPYFQELRWLFSCAPRDVRTGHGARKEDYFLAVGGRDSHRVSGCDRRENRFGCGLDRMERGTAPETAAKRERQQATDSRRFNEDPHGDVYGIA
jgi:hypothetical protein